MLVGVGNVEEAGFVERLADELEADGELDAVDGGEAAGDGDAGIAREVGGDGENVREIHFQRVAGALAGLESGLGAGGADDGRDQRL